uniref:tRNA-queuosine alpha-mannosyltransferase n=1 Tax=Magallana gigas TaxID=29159 RepID=A0A8W8NUY5_MAGGI
MTAKKWHWRSRVSALYLAQNIPFCTKYKVLFCSSVLNLAELVALRPDLASLKKIIYFHENQLVYPVREKKDRDIQHGYNQILSCLVADMVVFNSQYNMDSFLSSIGKFLHVIPDYRPKNIADQIKPKCQVIYFPLSDQVSLVTQRLSANQTLDSEISQENTSVLHSDQKTRPLHIVWAHRWEHDKGPELFFEVVIRLHREGCQFYLSVLGEQFTDYLEVFENSRATLQDHILHWGYLPSKAKFLKVLESADVAVSTALHEFFGVSMLEAVNCGCYPLCPNRLVYPEIYPKQYLYNTSNQLFKTLRRFCRHPEVPRQHAVQIDVSKFSWEKRRSDFKTLFGF